MSLSAGEKLGPYEILAPIGKGGMGEVYRACDTRLNRDVAIKISAERFTERFEREARAIASLNHPNICHLYDVGPNYLVMELVEGPTLADRIKQGGIPLEEALNIACQIADALEAAHEKGITHRDLKPGNINIKPDGTVKVLDFGLAKMGGTPTVQSDHSPTITVNHTEAGVILGTAAYMSPEQAKGKPVDQRADIYAFGAVLYEMLTHTRLHHGETTTEVLASVIKEEPRWDKVPAQVRRLLRRCLEKDPQKRLRHIGDVMALLDDEVAAPSSVAAQPARKARRIWPSIAALLFVVGSVFVFIHFHETPRTALEPVRFKIPLPEKTSLVPSGAFSVSPDGRKVVFAAGGPDGTRQLWVRTLDSLEAHPLPGVEIGNPPPPFWSPDSRFVAYNSGGKLNKVDVAGGPPQALCDLPANTLGGSWNRDGVIIFGTTQGLMRVSAAGGAAAAITALDASRKDFAHIYPTFLPDGKHFLYLRYSADPANSGVYVGSLDAKATEQSTKQLVATEYGPVYAPSMDGGTGHLLFLRQNVLMAQPLNERRLELAGDPVPVADQIGVSNGIRWGYFSVSANGVLLHRGGVGGQELQLTWFDRQGKVIGTVGEPGRYNTVFLSPDLKQAVVGQIDPQTSNDDLWILDLSKGTSTRFTFDPAPDTQPAWSPDSSQIAFFSSRSAGSGIYRKASNGVGSEELLLKSGPTQGIHWSPDGRFLVYAVTDPKTGPDLWVLPLNGDRKPIPFLRTDFSERLGHFSPDSRWIAYASNESGRAEIYVQPFNPTSSDGSSPGAGKQATGKWMVSKGGAAGMIRWRQDLKELYYLSPDGQLMAVEVSTTPAFHAGAPTPLFRMPATFLRASGTPGALADITPDGKRFIFAMPVVQNTREEFTVVENWQAGLKK